MSPIPAKKKLIAKPTPKDTISALGSWAYAERSD